MIPWVSISTYWLPMLSFKSCIARLLTLVGHQVDAMVVAAFGWKVVMFDEDVNVGL